MIIFFALVLYGSGLLTGVVEEKTSRVVEVLLGTVRPEHLLAGKVLGIVVAIVTQMLAALVAVGLALAVVGAAEIPSVALDVALISCVFLILGILSYSFLYAAVGATVSRQSEAESAQMPISLTLMVPYFISLTAVTDNPDGLLARVLSLLPPTAPMSMPARVATGDPLPIEIIASVALMFPWLLAVIWLAGRLYSGAILHSGPRLGLMAAWRGAADTRG
jgi:ABC-2 type transport system permease protein